MMRLINHLNSEKLPQVVAEQHFVRAPLRFFQIELYIKMKKDCREGLNSCGLTKRHSSPGMKRLHFSRIFRHFGQVSGRARRAMLRDQTFSTNLLATHTFHVLQLFLRRFLRRSRRREMRARPDPTRSNRQMALRTPSLSGAAARDWPRLLPRGGAARVGIGRRGRRASRARAARFVVVVFTPRCLKPSSRVSFRSGLESAVRAATRPRRRFASRNKKKERSG